jgi:hypothetical protein
MLLRRLIVTVVVFFGVVCFWVARAYWTNRSVHKDPTSEAALAVAQDSSQPLLTALEHYHAEHGLYPARLDQLPPEYLASLRGFDKDLYTERPGDRVFASDACVSREKSLHGWIMKETSAYQRDVDQFTRECVLGFKNFQLQSVDFPPDPKDSSLERWAIYDSFASKWDVGFCKHERSRRGQKQDWAMNGKCRR